MKNNLFKSLVALAVLVGAVGISTHSVFADDMDQQHRDDKKHDKMKKDDKKHDDKMKHGDKKHDDKMKHDDHHQGGNPGGGQPPAGQ